MSWTEFDFTDRNALAAACAKRLEAICRSAIAERGRAVLALAGGRTPFPAFRQLAATDLDFSKIIIVPTDERWVDAAHAASNFRAMREAFSGADGIDIRSLTPANLTPDAPSACHAIAVLHDVSQFDAVLLGMGNDAHTASLFPGSAQLANGLADSAPPALVVHPDPLPPEAPFARISLSLKRLLDARHVLLLISGEDKRAVLHEAQNTHAPMQQPISALLHAPDAAIEILWSP